jgi:integrase
MINLKSVFAEQIMKYLDWREALGYSRETDGNMLSKFDKYCAANQLEAKELTREVVCGWIDSDSTSLPNKTTAIRNFAKYMQAHGCDVYEYPTTGQGKGKGQFLPYMFTKEELRALFSAIDKVKPSLRHPYLPIILPTMFRLIYSCGLRPGEGRELLCDNINFETGAIRIVNAKGKKERMVVMSDDMLARCKKYGEERRIFAGVNPYFFPSDNGGVYTDRVIHQWFKNCWAAANPGVPESKLPSVRVYNLRHVFATTALTRWIESGANIKAKIAYLQAYMGHETINETLYYVHLLPETLLSGGKWDTLPGQDAGRSPCGEPLTLATGEVS